MEDGCRVAATKGIPLRRIDIVDARGGIRTYGSVWREEGQVTAIPAAMVVLFGVVTVAPSTRRKAFPIRRHDDGG